ncbi:Gp49 family protein [Pseudomonas luteola]|uniref:Gp49 family protein n=1 Tax=Pseudomonas luteola TaxID=47886 RepID=UPI003A854D8C
MSLPNRVTKEMIEGRIAKTEYHVVPNTTLTLAIITLDNGFTVRGESACVDPANFDKALGEQYAYQDGFNKLWPLLGFMLTEDRHREKLVALLSEPAKRPGAETPSPLNHQP